MGPDSSRHILMPARVSTVVLLVRRRAGARLPAVAGPAAGAGIRRAGARPSGACASRALVGLGIGLDASGLISDAGNGVLLGQHALAYSVLAFLALWLSRRILWFGPGLQALHVASHAAGRRGRDGRWCAWPPATQFPGWTVIVGPLAGAALWPMVSWLLLLPQRRLEREQTI